jgi:hypothetical protein
MNTQISSWPHQETQHQLSCHAKSQSKLNPRVLFFFSNTPKCISFCIRRKFLGVLHILTLTSGVRLILTFTWYTQFSQIMVGDVKAAPFYAYCRITIFIFLFSLTRFNFSIGRSMVYLPRDCERMVLYQVSSGFWLHPLMKMARYKMSFFNP